MHLALPLPTIRQNLLSLLIPAFFLNITQGAPPESPEFDSFRGGSSPMGYEEEVDRETGYSAILTQDGVVRGNLRRIGQDGHSLVTAQGARIQFGRSGRVIASFEPDINGRFEATGLSPGEYSVHVQGQDGLATFSLHVHAAGVLATNEVPEPLQILLTSPKDIPTVLSIAAREIPGLRPTPLAVPPAPAPSAESPIAAPKAGSPKFVGQAEVLRVKQTKLGTPLLLLSDSGETEGRAVRLDLTQQRYVPIAEVSLYFIRSGGIEAKVQPSANGEFKIPPMTPGFYTLVAAGTGGFTAITVEVATPPHATASTSLQLPASRFGGSTNIANNAAEYVSYVQAGPGSDLVVPVIPPGDLPAFIDPETLFAPPFAPEFGFAPPMGAGGFGGGMGGGAFGGGLGGGGGLWGALLGAGLGAGIGAAIANDGGGDSETVIVPPRPQPTPPPVPASPFIPAP